MQIVKLPPLPMPCSVKMFMVKSPTIRVFAFVWFPCDVIAPVPKLNSHCTKHALPVESNDWLLNTFFYYHLNIKELK